MTTIILTHGRKKVREEYQAFYCKMHSIIYSTYIVITYSFFLVSKISIEGQIEHMKKSDKNNDTYPWQEKGQREISGF